MKNSLPVLSLFLLLISGTFKTVAQENQNALIEKIDTYLTDGVSNGFSGSILIAKQGELMLHKGYGMANKEKSILYEATTVSTIGSVTKQFTATAILKLVEFDKIKVEDPLSNFFSKLPDDKKEITIHQLLTHTSGLIDDIGDGDFDDIPTSRFFKTLFDTELLHKPGTKHRYSNAGYSILARIIEIVSEQEYETFLNENLFQPAGMTKTGYFIPKWDDDSVASGYAKSMTLVGQLVEMYNRSGKITWSLKGNGGIHSTTEDMFKWYKALKSNKILSNALFEKLTTPYVKETEDGSSHYAYGWAIYTSDRNTKIISHNGGNSIFFHDYIWLPEEDVVIILFTNTSTREVEVAWPIEKMLFDSTYTPKPIKKNFFHSTFDFIKNNTIQNSDELSSMLKKEYGAEIRSPSELNNLGYRILKNDIIEIPESAHWAIEIFKLNTELFPESGNIYDSLGEAYITNNQKEEAIKSYEKALELAPDKKCDWCESTRKALKKLQKMK